MKTKVLKLLSVAAATLIMSTSLMATACSRRETTAETPSASGTITDTYERGELTNTLHKVNVTPNSREFVRNAGTNDASTEYAIVYTNDVDEAWYANRGAQWLAKYLKQASGASFTVEPFNAAKHVVTASSKFILYGCTEQFKNAGLTMPADKLGPSGYYIKSYGNNVFLEVEMVNGYQMGTLALLKAIVGYDMIADDCVAFENNGATLPDVEITERPDYDYSNYVNWNSEDGLYGLGFTGYPFIKTVNPDDLDIKGNAIHNIFNYLPKHLYQEKHPGWYADGQPQLCYTAHGDEKELEEMVETTLRAAKYSIEQNPNQTILTITQSDNSEVGCHCETCKAQIKEDGAISGTIIRFMNKVNEGLQKWVKEEKAAGRMNVNREIQIAFFAYKDSVNPPTKSVEEDPTLKCEPEVAVFIAPIHATYVKSFYDDVNEIYANQIRNWSHYADNILAWVYETNYKEYMFPYNTYSSMIDNYYFFKQCGANVMYNEGQRWSENVTCFGKLKEYLDAKAQFDVTISYEECKDKFFENYYMDAADIMEEYYNQLRQWETVLESKTENGLGGGVYELIGVAEFWPRSMLENWLRMMDKAYKAIAHYETEDPELYAKLYKHIRIETLFPQYALCTLHETSYSETELYELRSNFKKDADALGVKEFREGDYAKDNVTQTYRQWGLID